MDKTKSKVTGISLYEEEEKIVRKFAEKETRGNFSAAVSKIVLEWYELKQQDCKDSRPTG